MSIWIMLLIIAISAIMGGIVNFLLPANSVDGRFVKPWWQCMLLGFGATLLIPIFLELAQSKLLDDIHFKLSWEKPTSLEDSLVGKVDTLVLSNRYDSGSKSIKIDTSRKKSNVEPKTHTISTKSDDTGKLYFLWAAYCLLAAAAGFKFIDMLINKVVMSQELIKEKDKNEALTKVVTKQAKFAEEKQKDEEDHLLTTISGNAEQNKLLNEKEEILTINLPPVKNIEDPQKGRFKGSQKNNKRSLFVENVEEVTTNPNWFMFDLVVESSDSNSPLTGDVIFYLHNTFYNSVRKTKVIDGRAKIHLKKVYGAFTVGAIADSGKTLLELDLSEVKDFPRKFRER